ncbi:acetyl-CoA C-acyltransferase [Pseudarthrobacter sp. HLT3-5]|uniref:acetyl-CoA C-acyltransferase n=1 Tax=Pseudarthrobacter cellobiosi TaxID=2953654 RepID=UPI00208F512B|nr:acetyl-CoA C-acyltransferase [Pseudarthrobacter sp. HLT3-5]MCO4275977.1 acetyl-CoA C-acyltransferase [Pseudarthrobacter sp. HLT3-5]
MSAQDIVIVGAARTPQGKLMGQLSSMSAVQLGAAAIAAALERSGIEPDAVDAVIVGQVLTAGAGQNPARQSAAAAGIPLRTTAVTVNNVCLSGLSAIIQGTRLLKLGEADVVIAGGQESMSQAPHLLTGSRAGYLYGGITALDSASHDGLTDAFEDELMGVATDRANAELQVSREAQDRIAASSHQRAAAAQDGERFSAEIAPVSVPQKRKAPTLVRVDEGVRPQTTHELLAGLKPAFTAAGTVTAGNASPLSDGAAAVVLVTRAYADAHGLEVMAVVGPSGQIAGPDTTLPDKPAQAMAAALDRAGWTAGELDFVEINEAFASVVAHSAAALGLSLDKVNVNGGAIAIGHPIGASGARLVVSAVHELMRRGSGKSAVALCGGGGQGDALLLYRDGIRG